MTDYLYRILYRTRPEIWPDHLDPADNTWNVLNNRSYSTLTTAKGVRSNDKRNERTRHTWVDGVYTSEPRYEYRIQHYPLTQEWEDLDV